MSSVINFGTGLGTLENLISLVTSKRRVRIGEGVTSEILLPGSIELDASLEELHTQGSDVPRHPVEFGTDVTDHVRRKPNKLRIKGTVTNHPAFLAGVLGASQAQGLPIELDRAGLFFTTLEAIKNGAVLVTVITTLKTYDNMLISSFTVPRNATLGNEVEATIMFEELIIVSTDETTSPTPTDAANGAEANAGRAAPPPAAGPATTAQSQSGLSKMGQGVRAFFR